MSAICGPLPQSKQLLERKQQLAESLLDSLLVLLLVFPTWSIALLSYARLLSADLCPGKAPRQIARKIFSDFCRVVLLGLNRVSAWARICFHSA